MKCISCNAELQENQAFCQYCGAQQGTQECKCATNETTEGSQQQKCDCNQGTASPYAQECKNQQEAGAVPKDDKSKYLIAFSRIPILFWLGLLEGTPRGKDAATQGLWTFIIDIVGSILISIITLLLGWFLGFVLSFAWKVAILAIIIVGIVKSFKGEDFKIPVVGDTKIF